MRRDVVGQGPSKSRRKKTFAAFFFTGQCSCSGKPPAKQGLSLSKKIASDYGHVPGKRQKKDAYTVTHAGQD